MSKGKNYTIKQLFLVCLLLGGKVTLMDREACDLSAA